MEIVDVFEKNDAFLLLVNKRLHSAMLYISLGPAATICYHDQERLISCARIGNGTKLRTENWIHVTFDWWYVDAGLAARVVTYVRKH
jgi:hypothetical protein